MKRKWQFWEDEVRLREGLSLRGVVGRGIHVSCILCCFGGTKKDENLVSPGHTLLSLGELSLEGHCRGISNMLIWGVVMSVRRDTFRG